MKYENGLILEWNLVGKCVIFSILAHTIWRPAHLVVCQNLIKKQWNIIFQIWFALSYDALQAFSRHAKLPKYCYLPYPVDDVAGYGVDKYLGRHRLDICQSQIVFWQKCWRAVPLIHANSDPSWKTMSPRMKKKEYYLLGKWIYEDIFQTFGGNTRSNRQRLASKKNFCSVQEHQLSLKACFC